jgi:hypothetical protein
MRVVPLAQRTFNELLRQYSLTFFWSGVWQGLAVGVPLGALLAAWAYFWYLKNFNQNQNSRG